MYSKFISIAFVLAATLAPTSAVVLPRGDNEPTSSHASLCTTTTFSGGHSLVQTAPCTAKTSQHLHARDDPKLATATPVITPTATPTVTPTLTATPTVTPTLAATPATTHTPSVTPSATSTSPTTPLPTTTRPATTSPSTTITPSITPTPATSVTPTAQPTDTSKSNGSPSKASTSSCNDVQPWQDNLAYSAGAQVIFKNQLWTANQWSYNNNPESAAGAWTLNGVCNPPIMNKVDCTGVPAWNQPTAYPGGSKVTFNGHLWISTQWTQSNKPGDTSGTWKDLGVCL